MRNFNVKRSCVDCHFFGQADSSQISRIHREIKKGDRELLRDTTQKLKTYDDIVNFGCYHGEWRYPKLEFLQERNKGLLERDRKKCFFSPYQPGKSFLAVEKGADKRIKKRIFIVSILTLIAAVAAVVIPLILNQCETPSADPGETIRNVKMLR